MSKQVLTPEQQKNVFHGLFTTLGPVVGAIAFNTVCKELGHEPTRESVAKHLEARGKALAAGNKKDK